MRKLSAFLIAVLFPVFGRHFGRRSKGKGSFEYYVGGQSWGTAFTTGFVSFQSDGEAVLHGPLASSVGEKLVHHTIQ